MDKLMMVEKEIVSSIKTKYPDFGCGDIIKVYYKIKEKDKVRIHPIEGIVIKIQGSMNRRSFTVRRTAYGEAYEVTIPFYSPNIDAIELVRESRRRPRRKKLYYLRGRGGKKSSLA